MKPSFIEMIRNKKDILVDSYVKQYGEEYRDRISETINKINFVFYVNPDFMDDTLIIMRDNLERIATFKFLRRIGAVSSDLEIDKNSEVLKFKRFNTFKLLNAFFDDVYLDSSNCYRNKGIYSFLGSDGDFDVLKERIGVLSKLGLINILEKDYYEFSKSDLYKHAVYVYGRIALIAQKYALEIEIKCRNVSELLKGIYEKNLVVKRECMRLMVKELADLLPNVDEEFINSNPDFSLDDISGLDLLFDKDYMENVSDDFGVGILEVFGHDYDEWLLSGDASMFDKEYIVARRVEYLKRLDLKSDFNGVSALVPSFEIINRIANVRGEYELLYAYKAAFHMVIEGDISGLKPLDFEDMFCEKVGGYNYSDVIDGKKQYTVFINLLQSYFFLDLDNVIDHEIRHAIEFNYYYDDDMMLYKVGNEIVVNSEKDNICYFGSFNEAFTDMLSTIACEQRWADGKFIFSPRVYFEEEFGFDIESGYSSMFPNLSIVLGNHIDEFTRMRMNETNEGFYQILPFQDWVEIDKMLADSGSDTKEKLKTYSKKIDENFRK